MLVLAHRAELLEQACDKIRRANPELKIAVEQAGRIQVLANCMVLTEGYDEPSVSGIILARPTKSVLLYTQMIGRGRRLHPGKQDVTIIDIVDVTRDHSLTTLPGQPSHQHAALTVSTFLRLKECLYFN